MTLRNLLRSKPGRNEPKSATAMKLRKMVPTCPACHADLSGHRFAQLASTVVGDELKSRMIEFLGHAKRGNGAGWRNSKTGRATGTLWSPTSSMVRIQVAS